MLVIAESGGAASDIWRYCCPESDTYLELPKVDSRHDEAYVAACARLLPEIEELGKQTGTNSTKQMNFFVIDPDPEADNDNDLVLAIQTALLNDPNPSPNPITPTLTLTLTLTLVRTLTLSRQP